MATMKAMEKIMENLNYFSYRSATVHIQQQDFWGGRNGGDKNFGRGRGDSNSLGKGEGEAMKKRGEVEREKGKQTFLKTFGTSIKKFENSASLLVAPHVISISNMCAQRAWLTCRDNPPKKIANMNVHLKFSMMAAMILFSPTLYRMTPNATLPSPLNTKMIENHTCHEST